MLATTSPVRYIQQMNSEILQASTVIQLGEDRLGQDLIPPNRRRIRREEHAT